MRRRALLRGIALSGVAVATGCATTVSPPPSASPSTAPATSTTGTPTAVPTPVAPDWGSLRTALRDGLILSSDPAYDSARVLYNPRFDGVRPLAVARCASVDDVRACVRFARLYRIPLALRSGGHSYGGWSTGPGLVIDTSRMATIEVESGRVTVGAGARLIDVYDAVAARGQGIAAGSCPTVGIAGLTLGGGVGVLSRAWGLTCDDLVAARVVTADGEVRDCDETRDADLFWALRGGGGGSFGVVTSLTLRTHAASDLALGFLTWPWARAAAAVSGWNEWVSRAPDALWSTLHLDAGSGGGSVSVHAVHTGSARDISAQIDGLVALAGAPSYRESGTRTYRDVMLLEAGCLGRSVAECHLQGTTPEGQLARETFVAKSIVAPSALSADAVNALVAGVGSAIGHSDLGSVSVLIDSLGGAVTRIAPAATAFPHRAAFAILQLYAGWANAAAPAVADATTASLRQLHATLRPRIGPGAYVNYADPDLPDFADAYWGMNYPRLQRVKRTYDPDRIFDFPQAVRP